MTTEEKLQHFYEVSIESAKEEADNAISEYRTSLEKELEKPLLFISNQTTSSKHKRRTKSEKTNELIETKAKNNYELEKPN